MKNITFSCLLFAAALSAGGFSEVMAQDKGKVLLFSNSDSYNSRVLNLSDNGKFAVGSSTDGEAAQYPFLWDLTSDTQKFLKDMTAPENVCEYGDAVDVSDDGNIIVGTYNSVPAMYDVRTDSWTLLPMPEAYTSGFCTKVTPDGKFVIGVAYDSNSYGGTACLWKEGKLVEVKLPEKNLFGGNVNISCFDDITPDGSVLVGRLSYNESPAGSCAFVYDMEGQKFSYIAEDVMTAEDPGGYLLDNYIVSMSLSPDGKKLGGVFSTTVYTGKEGAEYDPFAVDTYQTSFSFDMKDRVFVNFGEDFRNKGVRCLDNNGVCYGVEPFDHPDRSTFVLKDGKVSKLQDYAKEVFGIEDLLGQTGCELSGSVAAVSADGNTIAVMGYLFGGLNYVISGNAQSGITELDGKENLDVRVDGKSLLLKGEVASVRVFDILGIQRLEVRNPETSIGLGELDGLMLVSVTGKDGKTINRKVLVK